MGPLICSALSRSILVVLGPPGLCLSQGRPNPGLCPGALCSGACAVGFALLAAQPSPQSCHPAPLSCSWSCSPLRDPPPEHLRVAPGAAQPPLHGAPSSARGTAAKLLPGHATPSTQSPARAPLSCSQVSACALQPLGSLVHSPGSAGVC